MRDIDEADLLGGRILGLDSRAGEVRVRCETADGRHVLIVFVGVEEVNVTPHMGAALSTFAEAEDEGSIRRFVFVNRVEDGKSGLEVLAADWFAVEHPFKLGERVMAKAGSEGLERGVVLFANLDSPAPHSYEEAAVVDLGWYVAPHEYQRPDSVKRPRILVEYEEGGGRIWLRADAQDVLPAPPS